MSSQSVYSDITSYTARSAAAYNNYNSSSGAAQGGGGGATIVSGFPSSSAQSQYAEQQQQPQPSRPTTSSENSVAAPYRPQTLPSTTTATTSSQYHPNYHSQPSLGGAGSGMGVDVLSLEEQSRLVSECSRRVEEQAYYMKRAIDEGDTPTALDRASQLLSELGPGSHQPNSSPAMMGGHHGGVVGSSRLTPKSYYELYTKALGELPHLEEYFLSSDDTEELYQRVQFCPRVLPRMYLQICAGTALLRKRASMDFVKTEEGENVTQMTTSIAHMRQELMEQVVAVQHPVRGLFLRHYLLQLFKYHETYSDKTNDTDDAYTETVAEALLKNFVEMVRLWVRFQHVPGQSSSMTNNHLKKERRRREKERNEVRVLVGTNLVRLSQLPGLTCQLYSTKILPKILEEVVSTGDALAQAYLMDCTVQVFPDDYHLETLGKLLDTCPKLVNKVNVRTILLALMDRLATHYSSNASAENVPPCQMPDVVFDHLSGCVQKVATARATYLQEKQKSGGKGVKAKPNVSEMVQLYTHLLEFSFRNYPSERHESDATAILTECADTLLIFSTAIGTSTAFMDDTAAADLEKLLSLPSTKMGLESLLNISCFGGLLEHLPVDRRRTVALGMVQSLLDGSATTSVISSVNHVEGLFGVIRPVFLTTDVAAVDTDLDDLVAGCVRCLYNEDTDVNYQLLLTCKKHLMQVGKQKTQTSLTALIYVTYDLLRRVHRLEFASLLSTEEAKTESTDNLFTDAETPKTEIADETEANDDAEPKDETKEDTAIDTDGASANPSRSTEDDDCVVATDDVEKTEATTAENEEQPPTVVDDTNATVDNETKIEEMVQELSVQETAELGFNKSTDCRKVFLFLQNVISNFNDINVERCYRLYLDVATLIASLPKKSEELSNICREFFSQAFLVYEEDNLPDRRAAVEVMVGTLENCRRRGCFYAVADYESLVTKTAQCAAKLPKKADQCQMVATSSHLFFVGDDPEDTTSYYRNHQRVLECLQRSLKIADACVRASPSDNLSLFVDVFEKYVFYYEMDNPLVTDRFVNGLIALINEHFADFAASNVMGRSNEGEKTAKAHYNQVIAYLRTKKTKHGDDSKYGKITC